MKYAKIKILSLMLALTLVLLFAACGAESEAAASGASSEASGAASSVVASTQEAEAEAAAEGEAVEAAGEPATEEEPAPLLPAAAMPYEADEGRLVITGLFQSSMPNPDNDNLQGDNVGTVELTNQSGVYLDSAVLEVTLTDGTSLSFEIDSIPAGGTVWALDRSSTSVGAEAQIAEVTCMAYYLDEMPMQSEIVSVEVDGIVATVTNCTDAPVTGLAVEFHGILDDVYYGGIPSRYNLDELPAGASQTIVLEDCWLGLAEAVRVTDGGS